MIRNQETKYLTLLAAQFSTINSAAAEIINLSSMLNLPKGTEHFISDIHGEYSSFTHVLKNGSGSIARKVADELMGKDYYGAGHRAQLEDFTRAVRDKRAPLVTWQAAAGSAELVIQIYESAKGI